MSMGKSLDEFARRLTDSTLATAAEVADWRKESQAANTEQFARWLVRQRKLTAYQAQQVYAGKGRALVLGNYVILAGIEAFRKARPDVHLHVDGQDYPAASTAAGD
jgi:hypothetical protein